MNAAGLIIIALGLILIVIGVKGSQHNIINSLKGVPNAASNPQPSKNPANQQTAFYPTPSGNPPSTPLLNP
jgi:hypothetical protein